MDVGNIVAAAIAFGSMCVAVWQAAEARHARKTASEQARIAEAALTETRKQTELARDARTTAALNLDAAEKAASAAQASADEARKANVLTQAQHDLEKATEAAAALARARKVHIEVSGMGGYRVHVLNGSDEPFHNLELENFVRVDRPSWTWRINRNVAGATSTYNRIDPGKEKAGFIIDLLNEDGTPQPFDLSGNEVEVTISYTDVDGQRWRRVGAGDPQPVHDG